MLVTSIRADRILELILGPNRLHRYSVKSPEVLLSKCGKDQIPRYREDRFWIRKSMNHLSGNTAYRASNHLLKIFAGVDLNLEDKMHNQIEDKQVRGNEAELPQVSIRLRPP